MFFTSNPSQSSVQFASKLSPYSQILAWAESPAASNTLAYLTFIGYKDFYDIGQEVNVMRLL